MMNTAEAVDSRRRKTVGPLKNAHTLKGTWSAVLRCKPHSSMYIHTCDRDFQVI